MGGSSNADDLNALTEVLRPLVERHGKDRIKQALKQINPPRKPGRPKGAKYSDPDFKLMLEARHLYLYGRFCGDSVNVREPVRTPHAAIQRAVERFWPESRGTASTQKHVVRRLFKRLREDPLFAPFNRIVRRPGLPTIWELK